jgi:disulfide bond formation protein DsbB
MFFRLPFMFHGIAVQLLLFSRFLFYFIAGQSPCPLFCLSGRFLFPAFVIFGFALFISVPLQQDRSS